MTSQTQSYYKSENCLYQKIAMESTHIGFGIFKFIYLRYTVSKQEKTKNNTE